MRMLRSRHSRSSSRKICNSSIDIESEGTGNGKYIGKSVYKGTAIGPINVLKKSDGIVKRQHVEDVAAELQRLEDAKKQAQAQLGALYEKALQEVGEVNAQIFEVHQMMLEDEDYQDAIHSMIETEELNAEYAVAVTGDNFAEIFANMDDEYMQARSADVKDISNRLIRNLSGEEELDWAHMEPSIIVADDLTPSETVQMDKRKILAFVTVHGSTNSHTAILARMMNIPALIGVPVELDSLHSGTMGIVDGKDAVFCVDPDEATIAAAHEMQARAAEQKRLLANYKGRPSVTKSGRKVNVYANIGSVSDVAYVQEMTRRASACSAVSSCISERPRCRMRLSSLTRTVRCYRRWAERR